MTVCETCPISLISSILPDLVIISKLPSEAETTDVRSPLTFTVAPAMMEPSLESVIFPLITDWAKMEIVLQSSTTNSTAIFLIRLFWLKK